MVNPDGSILLKKEYKGILYIVISTENGESRSVWDAIDTIKNTKTKELKTMTRKNWKIIFDNIK